MLTPEMSEALKRPFPPDELEWLVIHAKKTESGTINVLCAPYVKARAIMARLDTVFGAHGWSETLRPVTFAANKDEGFICSLTAGGVTHEDVAELSSVSPIKGGSSDAFKRVAVKFGIGRYLYDMGRGYIESKQGGFGAHEGQMKEPGSGKVIYFRFDTPALPDWAIPDVADVRIGDRLVQIPIESMRVIHAIKVEALEATFHKAFAELTSETFKAQNQWNKRWTPRERYDALVRLCGLKTLETKGIME